MKISPLSPFWLLMGALSLPCLGGDAGDAHSGHELHTDCAGSVSGSWLAPWEHGHTSPAGVPLVHPFGFEPAVIGRDILPGYHYAEFDEGVEHEIEVEVEWAFTRRLGVVLAQAYVFDRPDGGPDSDGWGDLAVVPSALVVEKDRFLASLFVEVVIPTGSSTVGAGEEWRLAPFTSLWFDLGNAWSLTSALGVEFALASNETELFFGLGLNKAIRVHEPAGGDRGDAHHHGHVHHHDREGLLFLTAELSGLTVLDGEPDEEGDLVLEGLLGASYSIGPDVDLRVAADFPLNSNSELDWGVQGGLIYHY